MHIFSYLTFGDLEHFRRTSHFVRTWISKPFIMDIFPNIKATLLSTCYECLSEDPGRNALVRIEKDAMRYPFSSQCFKCVARTGEFTIGKRYQIGNNSSAWICRWCGMPVTTPAAWNQPEFHRACFRSYMKTLLCYVMVGVVQAGLALVASPLCWSFSPFRQDARIWGPAIVRLSPVT